MFFSAFHSISLPHFIQLSLDISIHFIFREIILLIPRLQTDVISIERLNSSNGFELSFSIFSPLHFEIQQQDVVLFKWLVLRHIHFRCIYFDRRGIVLVVDATIRFRSICYFPLAGINSPLGRIYLYPFLWKKISLEIMMLNIVFLLLTLLSVVISKIEYSSSSWHFPRCIRCSLPSPAGIQNSQYFITNQMTDDRFKSCESCMPIH